MIKALANLLTPFLFLRFSSGGYRLFYLELALFISGKYLPRHGFEQRLITSSTVRPCFNTPNQ
ncbi:hypothetical protein KW530_04970 [Vibrio fluvialis]|nr:hypothetical protein [Vibrio fluvialis]MBY7900294.1 hypothetical protein [Vibrio fluvialis]MBY7939065.1 hypothetical protein [Vibrio fluvialis]MBY8165572.1 hypothetical protein [Vibrio fluvialis]MBY8255887.1 hypothetical protein [Vibrio fluvialis]